jgi:spore coat polysaccharide biosynthesis predicted glycosyltransferase SpsG
LNSEIIIRANGSTKSGLGHLYRGLAISECIPKGIDFTFVTNYNKINTISNSEINVYILNDTEDDFIVFEKFANLKLIIIDGYTFGSNYQKKLRNKGYCSIYIDDLANEYMYSDIVINHSPGFKKNEYFGEPYVKYFLGPKYSIIRKDFVENKISTKTKKGILVMMGGSDQFDITKKILKYLNKNYKTNDPIYVVLGNNYLHFNKQFIFNNLNIVIYRNLKASELSELMMKSKFGIMPASTVLYEFLMCGGFALCGHYIENQIKVYNYFLMNKLIFPLGNLNIDFEKELIYGLENYKINNRVLTENGFDRQSIKRLSLIIKNLMQEK